MHSYLFVNKTQPKYSGFRDEDEEKEIILCENSTTPQPQPHS